MAGFCGQIATIREKIAELVGPELAAQIMEGQDKIKDSTKPPKVSAWFKEVLERLDTLVDADTRARIMSNCGYNCARINHTALDRAAARRKKYDSFDVFLAAEQQNPPAGTRLERDGHMLYQFYTPQNFTHPMRCYCSLLRGLPEGETVSLTYCNCSRGFVEKYWENLLQKPVQVDLLESAVSGAAECKFVIHL
ncbi:MAG TPA: DUF6144 family protein [Phototrophicaceae bacterium]|nr:DUF6144 family protein [Phototrophicaceae bacterium]